ncbi:hypothetical protein KEM55_003053 [Ascosphaera atra]|nr:hypothetical protein KEM55_003053 [Ascosphaera atra]
MSRFGGGAKRRRLPGQEFSWESGPGGEQDTAPTPLFPKYHVSQAKPLSSVEALQVDYYRQLREKIHDGPYYVVLPGVSSGGNKSHIANGAQIDPFQGMATYGQRYQKKTRALPKLTGRPYAMNLFPKELWTTLDPNYVGLAAGAAGGAQALKSRKQTFEDEDVEDEEPGRKRADGEEEEDDEERGTKRRRGDAEDDLLEDEEEGDEEEIVDNDFEEDEDDMADDYNAEQYFDGGSDDAGDYDLNGGDDGDVY